MMSQDVALIIRLMLAAREVAWDDEGFREVVVRNFSFGQVQAILRELDVANERLDAIREFKGIDSAKNLTAQ